MPLLELLGRGVPLYGLLGVLGACLGLVCALVRCPSFGLSRDDCAYLYVFGAIGAAAGAKLLYLLPRLPQLAAELPLLWESPAAFAARWLSGGLVFYGGLFGASPGLGWPPDISGRTSRLLPRTGAGGAPDARPGPGGVLLHRLLLRCGAGSPLGDPRPRRCGGPRRRPLPGAAVGGGGGGGDLPPPAPVQPPGGSAGEEPGGLPAPLRAGARCAGVFPGGSGPPLSGAPVPPPVAQPGGAGAALAWLPPGRSGSHKEVTLWNTQRDLSVSKKPRRVRARRREKIKICFLRRHKVNCPEGAREGPLGGVRRRKHFSGRKRGICPAPGGKSCGAADCILARRKSDSLRSRCGIHSVTSFLIGYVSWSSSAWSGRTTHIPAPSWTPRCRRPHRPRRCRRSDPGSPPGSAAPRCS